MWGAANVMRVPLRRPSSLCLHEDSAEIRLNPTPFCNPTRERQTLGRLGRSGHAWSLSTVFSNLRHEADGCVSHHLTARLSVTRDRPTPPTAPLKRARASFIPALFAKPFDPLRYGGQM